MKASLSALLLLSMGCLTSSPAAAQAISAPGRTAVENEIVALQDKWHLAYAHADLPTLLPLLLDGFTVTDSSGEVLDREALSAPDRARAERVTLAASDHKIRFLPDTAIVTSKVVEGRGAATLEFRVTDTYVRQGDRWRVAASQWTRTPGQIEEAGLEARALDRLTGSYVTPRGVSLKVLRRAGRLVMVDPRGQEEEFIATSDSQFFGPRSKARWVFIGGDQGVTHAVIANQLGLITVTQSKQEPAR